MGAEGLEGLLPRGWELLRLGFGFFLPFLPFMALFSLLFTLTFWLFGADFLHDGAYFAEGDGKREASPPPPYILPEALLAEPTRDRMVPFTQPQPPQ